MYKSLLVALLLIRVLFLGAQIPNSDFELWDYQPVLQGWVTNSHPLTLPAWDPYIVRQDTNSYSGRYAANFHANGLFKPYATTTFPVHYRPVALRAMVKYSFAPCVNDSGFPEQDTISIAVQLMLGAAVVDSGYWEYHQPGFLAGYQPLLVPISNSASAFDSCRITIQGGKVNGGCGIIAAATEFTVDHLELRYSSGSSCIDSSRICDTCFCVAVYDPVCGCNGWTYGNECEAYIAGVTSWNQGACDQQNADSCVFTGIVTQGVECLLIADWQSGSLLMPCSLPPGAVLHAGDTVAYNYAPGNCLSFCMQGSYVDITCFQIVGAAPDTGQQGSGSCHAYFSFQKQVDSVWFINASTAPAVPGYLWTFGDGQSDTAFNPMHVYAQDGDYSVCLQMTALDSLNQPCYSQFCDTITITHACIDTTLMTCTDPVACCDFVPYQPVCGCDSVTYNNSCEAINLFGVSQYYPGACVTGLQDPDAVLQKMSLWPNPAAGQAQLQLQLRHPERLQIRVSTIIGETVFQTEHSALPGAFAIALPTASWPAGVYLVQLQADGNTLGVRKLVKAR